MTLDATGENLELKAKPKTTESRRQGEKKKFWCTTENIE
jgi:hypothetical protein